MVRTVCKQNIEPNQSQTQSSVLGIETKANIQSQKSELEVPNRHETLGQANLRHVDTLFGVRQHRRVAVQSQTHITLFVLERCFVVCSDGCENGGTK